MEKEGLVSIITPCHNSSKFIHRLLDSVLEQTYGKIEMITVDNASEDDTPEIIKKYIPKFEAKGYSVKYIRQENLGPSAGIQTGLRVITGEYLLMPDSDDWYARPDSIETFVNKFKEFSDEYAIIRCQQNFVDEETMKTTEISYQNASEDDPGTLFEDCLFGKKGYVFSPISYMVRTSALRKETGMEIYNAFNTGQQRQICLPLYYNYKAWTIKEPLVCYLVRKASVSHGAYSNIDTQVLLYEQSAKYIDTIFSTIKNMPEREKDYYRSAFLKQQAERMAQRANKAGVEANKYIRDYMMYGGSGLKLRFKLFILRIGRPIKKLLVK